MGKTANDVIRVMQGWLGYSESDGRFRQIIDLYNSVSPLPRGYKVRYTDEWCDTTVSAAGIKAGCSDLIGRECSCTAHIRILKEKGIWIEDGSITPQPGDIIFYNWSDSTQPNDGDVDHVGIVERVSGGYITAIEGNRHSEVARRMIPVGWGYIRGFGRPKYISTQAVNMSTHKSTEAGNKSTEAGNKSTKLNNTSTKIAVDGSWGKATTLRAQQVFGTAQDGVISGQPNEYKKYFPNVYTIQYVSYKQASGSQLVRAMQKKLDVAADGFFGPNTVKAFQKWLGVKQDCSVGPDTVKAFQKWLNARG